MWQHFRFLDSVFPLSTAGIANAMWQHGDMQLLSLKNKKTKPKQNLHAGIANAMCSFFFFFPLSTAGIANGMWQHGDTRLLAHVAAGRDGVSDKELWVYANFKVG